MEVGQSVYVQKNELVFDKWYKAHIIDIRQTKRPASQGTTKDCLVDMVTCCSKLPLSCKRIGQIIERL